MKHLYRTLYIVLSINILNAQYLPKNTKPEDIKKAADWTDTTYRNLSQDEKLGQLFIVALYTNRRPYSDAG